MGMAIRDAMAAIHMVRRRRDFVGTISILPSATDRNALPMQVSGSAPRNNCPLLPFIGQEPLAGDRNSRNTEILGIIGGNAVGNRWHAARWPALLSGMRYVR